MLGIMCHGKPKRLDIRPVAACVGGSKHFTWGPDGEYNVSTELFARESIVIYAALGEISLQYWLVEDLGALSAVHELDRCSSQMQLS